MCLIEVVRYCFCKFFDRNHLCYVNNLLCVNNEFFIKFHALLCRNINIMNYFECIAHYFIVSFAKFGLSSFSNYNFHAILKLFSG